MTRAIALSREGLFAGAGGPFGAVVTRGDRIIGEGYNRVLGDNDPTAHAEVTAIRAACAAIGSFVLDDCVLYASCRPCPMCLAATMWARIPVCWYANSTEDAARIGFDDKRFHGQFAVHPEGLGVELVRVPDRGLIEAAGVVFDEAFGWAGFRLY